MIKVNGQAADTSVGFSAGRNVYLRQRVRKLATIRGHSSGRQRLIKSQSQCGSLTLLVLTLGMRTSLESSRLSCSQLALSFVNVSTEGM